MGLLRRFWTQPVRAYRNFQIVFTILVVQFVVPAVSYLVRPRIAVEQVTQANALFARWFPFLGNAVYDVAEHSHLWRILAVANVLTLGFACVLLQVNVRRFYAAILPLAFLKGTASLSFLGTWLFVVRFPYFFGVFLLDGLTTLAIVYFATSAARAIARSPGAPLVPPPWRGRGAAPGALLADPEAVAEAVDAAGASAKGRGHGTHGRVLSGVERRLASAMTEAVFPRTAGAAGPGGALPGGGEVDAAGCLDRLLWRAPWRMRFGARLALWAWALGPLFVIGRPRLATRLDPEARDRYVQAWVTHRLYLVRALGLYMKALASMAYFADARVQAAAGLPGA